MKISMIARVVPFLAVATAMPAQGETPKPATPEKPAKAGQEPRPDSEATMKDPAIMAIDAFIKEQAVVKTKDQWRLQLKEPPKQTFDKDSDYFWHIETAVGAMKLRYLPDAAPMHVTSGIYLSRLGYYDGLGFHRIIPGFMAQGGCPNTADATKARMWGTGNPGFMMDGEFIGNRKHDKAGILSMANTGQPHSEGSQFFITFGPTGQLDGKYSIWGEVVEGMDTLRALEKNGISQNNGMLPKPIEIVRTWISVEKKPKADEKKDGAKKDGETGGDKTGK